MKRLKTTVVLMVLASVCSQSSHSVSAQAPQGTFMAYGPTQQSCGVWTTNSGLVRDMLLAWTDGFVSGADFQRVDHLTQTDNKGIEAWMTKYCAEHPLDGIVKAAIQLVTELGAKSTR
jgi:hypothetical protein